MSKCPKNVQDALQNQILDIYRTFLPLWSVFLPGHRAWLWSFGGRASLQNNSFVFVVVWHQTRLAPTLN